MNTIAILWDIVGYVGNLRALSTTRTSAYIYLRVYLTNFLYRTLFLTSPNCVHCNELSRHPSRYRQLLSTTIDHFDSH